MGVGIMGRRPTTTIVQLQPSFSNPNKYRLNDAREDAGRMLRLRKELFNLSPVEVTVRCVHSHQHTIVFKNGRLGFKNHDRADFQADKAFIRLSGEKIKAFRCHNVLLAWSGNRPFDGTYIRLDYRIIPAAFRAVREKGREISSARWDVRRNLDHAAGNRLDVLSLPTEERKRFRLAMAVEKLLKGYEKELTYTLGRDKRGKKFFIVFKADTADGTDVSMYHWDTPKQGIEYQVSIPALDFFRVHRKGLAIVSGMLAVKIHARKHGKNVVLTLLRQTTGTTTEWNPATKAWDRQVTVPDLETRLALVSPDKKVVKWL